MWGGVHEGHIWPTAYYHMYPLQIITHLERYHYRKYLLKLLLIDTLVKTITIQYTY